MSMSGAELRAIRQQLGFSLTRFAPQLGIHWNTLARFERGEINISGPVEKLARLLLQLAEKDQDEPEQESKLTRRRVGMGNMTHARLCKKQQDRKKRHV